jgi:hypothetical protein
LGKNDYNGRDKYSWKMGSAERGNAREKKEKRVGFATLFRMLIQERVQKN